MKNDIAVYDALRANPATGEREWAGRMGTRQAILRDGLVFEARSVAYCPHEWIDMSGYVDAELAKKYPYHFAI